MRTSKENRVLLDNTLGLYLRKIREDNDYTVIQMAKILNVSKSFLSYIENGERLPTMKTLYDFAEHFGLDAKMLVEKRIITVKNTFEIHGENSPHHVLNEYYLVAYFS